MSGLRKARSFFADWRHKLKAKPEQFRNRWLVELVEFLHDMVHEEVFFRPNEEALIKQQVEALGECLREATRIERITARMSTLAAVNSYKRTTA